MKIIKRILLGLLLLIVISVAGIYIFLQTQKPQYTGTLKIKGLKNEVNVLFDDYGVPHIYGQNEEDIYFAFGYVHAQERLFQMEMMRRVSAGRLAEILGSSLLDVDKFFRMLGIAQHAEESAKQFMSGANEPYQKAALAYLAGVNEYIENGKTPLEFRLIGIPKEKYNAKDMYLIVDYMSFTFQMAFKTDPLMSKIKMKLGEKYLKDLAIDYVAGTEKVPVHPNDSIAHLADAASQLSYNFSKIENELPIPVWLGSNAFVVSPQKTKSGKVLFENDTHIGFGQPSVWYEAHLECPGFSFYGSHLAGFPFAPIGHTPQLAWGLTIFENDDLDFYQEKTNPENKNQIWKTDHWENMQVRNEIIKVKDSADYSFNVLSTNHGPVCNNAMKDFIDISSEPISVCWTLLKFPTNLFQVSYSLSHSKGIDDTRKAVSQITAPGLNVLYGDAEGNIAWWSAAKLVKRPPHINSRLLLDGSSGKDDWQGWYDFSSNPQSENPPNGFVYSANNQPDSMNSILYPGYYAAEDRAKYLVEQLSENKKFDLPDFQKINSSVTSPVASSIAKVMMNGMSDEEKNKSANNKKAIEILNSWNGSHNLSDVAPTIFYKLEYHILHDAMADELGEKDMTVFILTHVEKNSIAPLLQNDSSVWWDNVNTKDKVETRKNIFEKAFDTTIKELENQLGKNMNEWKWAKVHTIEHVHPIGRQKPFDKFFNVGPFAIEGGNETVNNQGFDINGEGIYKVRYGPALRRVIDFADALNAQSVIPTGQSGNAMSKHYADQAQMYVNHQTRKEMMDKNEIEKVCKDKLVLQPR